MTAETILAAAVIGGYLLGSIPFGLVLTKLTGAGDLRAIGSGNIGATNVLRTGRKGLAAATLILDGGKGAVATLIAAHWSADAALAAAVGAVFGHNFPVWIGFRGGKGVATTFGVWLALAWPVGLGACLTWVATAALFRYSSLSALVAFALSPLYAYFVGDLKLTAVSAALAALGIARHHANIRRLIAGQEPKIGRKTGS